ncbi:MAG: hypothetical protein KAQ71_00145 [Desulfobulbaceae bacterium]|nr:hypothetical protein [Desulfobulbaceae bacterium]
MILHPAFTWQLELQEIITLILNQVTRESQTVFPLMELSTMHFGVFFSDVKQDNCLSLIIIIDLVAVSKYFWIEILCGYDL